MSTVHPAQAGFVQLEDLAVLRLSGSATRDFLSRQLTCDVSQLRPDHAVLGAWLTPKGRVVSLMHVLERTDGVLLAVLPRELADDVIRRMRLFVMRDDVRIEPDPNETVLGLAGEAGDAAARPGTLALAALSNGLTLAVGPLEAVRAIAEQLSSRGFAALSREQWELAQIRAGLPAVVASTREAFIPQMLNLDRLGAVSFSKGCYPGQEIVARTQHLGRIKRRTFLARTDEQAPLARPGDSLPSADAASSGKVVRAALHDNGQDLLVVLPLDAVRSGTRFSLPDGARLEVSPPPYALDERPP